MKTIIESLLELSGISDNNNRIELYKGMAQKLREVTEKNQFHLMECCLLYTSPSPRDYAASRMPSSA